MKTLLYLAITFLLVLLNGFFVAAEFALVKIRPTRLEELVKEGDARAKLVLTMSQQIQSYLSSAQLGITLASLGLGWVGEPAVAEWLETRLNAIGISSHLGVHAIAFAIAFFFITALHMIVGEIVPKSLAIERTERIALASAVPMRIFYLVAWPVSFVLNGAANVVMRAIGLSRVREDDLLHTSDELRMLLVKSPAGLDPALRSMLVRIFDLRRRTARHVMTLRSETATLRAVDTVEDAVKVVGEAGYSRYPVLDEGGAVIGYLHLRDLFDVMAGRRKAKRVAELIRKPIYAREGTSVERLRREMQARQIPVAIVRSEAGELVGLVTIEDLLEEIVGEIRDENDEEVPPMNRRGGGILEVDGRLLLSDLERDASVTLRPEVKSVETVGGYVIARLARPAEVGERVECEGRTLVVTDVAGRRVRRVRIVPENKE